MAGAPPVPPDLAAAEALLRDSEHPGFAEPWQAEAFACAIQLSRQGLYTWAEWVAVFAAEIRAHPAAAGESAEAAYYRQLLAALETIVGKKGAASSDEITARQEAWRQAYLNTPHGQPVTLENAAQGAGAGHHHHPGHDHHRHDHHGHAPKPVAVSPAR
jgi:nitrile hydratase accessory protein